MRLNEQRLQSSERSNRDMTFTTKLLAGAAGLARSARHGARKRPVLWLYRLIRMALLMGTLKVTMPTATQTRRAAVQCCRTAAALQPQSIGSILGAVLGANTSGRVLSITQVNPRPNGTIRIRGLASSGRHGLQRLRSVRRRRLWCDSATTRARSADLSFRCDVDPARLCPQRRHQPPLLKRRHPNKRSAGKPPALFSMRSEVT